MAKKDKKVNAWQIIAAVFQALAALFGCHVFYLTRVPSPAIIAAAFAEVKPTIIIAVPLVIEKIIRKKVLPELQPPSRASTPSVVRLPTACQTSQPLPLATTSSSLSADIRVAMAKSSSKSAAESMPTATSSRVPTKLIWHGSRA